MAFGLARNAQSALELIGLSAAQCLERTGAVPMRSVRLMLARGEGAGNVADETNETDQGKRLTSIVHRAAFLKEILAGIPQNRMHASKKLEGADQDGSLTCHFTDGTTHECDILIDADGIHSAVRKFIFGENNAAAVPRSSGSWFLMTLQPFDKARAILGKELVDMENAREYGWVGQNTFLMHNILSDGELVQFAIASNDSESNPSRWTAGSALRASTRLNTALQPTRNIKPYTSENTQKHRLTFRVQCALLAMLSIQQHRGKGLAVACPSKTASSSLPYSGVLRHLCTEALTALKVYDRVRRPRTQRVVESGRVTGDMLMGRSEETGLAPKKFG
ncbi:salicylate hydroxylase [Daldinia vernicosa]|uniref:salicylate hydroxylase n=1 Tax=Daldinia vernicosa TaxID=114800 RepID=UPI002008313B|nr:salicylate hydroxylase [Daldinia vernicosa]KAI0853709.1 salicylate hydroxylase [Daldinia vernicosa]